MAAAKNEDKDEKAPEVDQSSDAVEDRGYRGFQADSTPNENYTVAGVLAGKPTPETDSK